MNEVGVDYNEDNDSILDATDCENTENESVDQEVDGETQHDEEKKKLVYLRHEFNTRGISISKKVRR